MCTQKNSAFPHAPSPRLQVTLPAALCYTLHKCKQKIKAWAALQVCVTNFVPNRYCCASSRNKFKNCTTLVVKLFVVITENQKTQAHKKTK